MQFVPSSLGASPFRPCVISLLCLGNHHTEACGFWRVKRCLFYSNLERISLKISFLFFNKFCYISFCFWHISNRETFSPRIVIWLARVMFSYSGLLTNFSGLEFQSSIMQKSPLFSLSRQKNVSWRKWILANVQLKTVIMSVEITNLTVSLVFAIDW